MRHDLPEHEGRGVDDLLAALRSRIAGTVVGGLGESELRRAFAVSVSALLEEAQQIDSADPSRALLAPWEWSAGDGSTVVAWC